MELTFKDNTAADLQDRRNDPQTVEQPPRPAVFAVNLRDAVLLRQHLDRRRGQHLLAALRLIRLGVRRAHLVSRADERLQARHGEIRRAHEDDAKCQNIIYILKLYVAGGHLIPDRIDGFNPFLDFEFIAHFFEFMVYRL